MNSSCISSVDTSGSDLIITFKSGRTYGYSGAANLAPALRSAPSAGQFFNTNIRGKFDSVAVMANETKVEFEAGHEAWDQYGEPEGGDQRKFKVGTGSNVYSQKAVVTGVEQAAAAAVRFDAPVWAVVDEPGNCGWFDVASLAATPDPTVDDSVNASARAFVELCAQRGITVTSVPDH